MKTIAVVMLSFLVFVLSANPLLAAPEVVHDNEGDELRPGVEYYILPVDHIGGGFTSGLNRYKTHCPPDVVQDPSDFDLGRPVTFIPIDPKTKVVQPLTNVSIMFSDLPFCHALYFMWNVHQPLTNVKTLESFCVYTIGYPGPPNTLSNWFRIEKIERFGIDDHYKLLFCYFECLRDSCKDLCRYLGINVFHNGVRHLCLSDEPLEVFFVKKPNTITTSSY